MNEQTKAQRLAELEAMHERGTIRRGHIDEMLTELRRLDALNAELVEALKLADAMLCGANMDAKIVEKKVLAALAKAKEQT